MARIRTIKPEFWADEKLAPMQPIDRLVFLGLISMADDAGRVVDNVKAIDGFVFPETDDTCRNSLDTLARVGRVERYESESGQRILQVANWLKHQKVDHASKYVLPAPSRKPREDRARVSRDDRASTLDLGPTTYDLATATARAREGAAANGQNGRASDADSTHSTTPPASDADSTPAPTAAPPTVVLTAAANRGITERWGEQPNPLRHDAPSSMHAADAIASAGVPIDFARDATYTCVVEASIERPPRSLKYCVEYVVDRWKAQNALELAARSDARVLTAAVPSATRGPLASTVDQFTSDIKRWMEGGEHA